MGDALVELLLRAVDQSGDPALAALSRPGYWFWGLYMRTLIGSAPVKPCPQRSLLAALCRWNLKLSVRNRALRGSSRPPINRCAEG